MKRRCNWICWIQLLLFLGVASTVLALEEKWLDLSSMNMDLAWREAGDWVEVGSVSLEPVDEKVLRSEAGRGILMNGPQGKTIDLLSSIEHGDVELHVEFMVPRGSNSGVYLQARYEIQIFDSWGVEEPRFSDCGGIYQRWVAERGFAGHPPRTNASRRPGEWQSFDVLFRAPRFDSAGNKTENARFVRVLHNGVLVHENVDLTGPTRASTLEDEAPRGPLMLQGDHGPVAFRNIRLRHHSLN